MVDERIKVLANNLVNYSMRVKKGDNVYINYVGKETQALAKQLIKEVYAVGGNPYPHFTDPVVEREMLLGCNEEQLKVMAQTDASEMAKMDCYVGVRGSDNVTEYSDVLADKMKLYSSLYSTPVHHDIRVPKTRWVVLRYPNSSMAQLADMSKIGRAHV